jgi:hypothetical protein
MELHFLLRICGDELDIDVERLTRLFREDRGEFADDPARSRSTLAHTYQTPIVRELTPRPADQPGDNSW